MDRTSDADTLTALHARRIEAHARRTVAATTPRIAIATCLLCALSAGTAHALDVVRHALPEDFTYPEGIALQEDGRAFYTASAETGAVLRVEVASNTAHTVVPPGRLVPQESEFPGLLGLELDDAGRLWIAGGRTGTMFVVDARSGAELSRHRAPRTPSLINDVAIASGGAFFTDSLNPVLWRIEARGERAAEPEPWLDLSNTAIRYGEGANLNGIEATPDGRALIVVQMNKGLLYRIDIASKSVTPIDTGGAALTGGDGLVLDGPKLYVVRQPNNEIVVLELASNGRSARKIASFTDPALAYPATAVKTANRLLVVNTQFDRHGTGDPKEPFTVVGIALDAFTRRP
jgi:sugar lactone lactonase YvrE